jgi:hypothetical protein
MCERCFCSVSAAAVRIAAGRRCSMEGGDGRCGRDSNTQDVQGVGCCCLQLRCGLTLCCRWRRVAVSESARRVLRVNCSCAARHTSHVTRHTSQVSADAMRSSHLSLLMRRCMQEWKTADTSSTSSLSPSVSPSLSSSSSVPALPRGRIPMLSAVVNGSSSSSGNISISSSSIFLPSLSTPSVTVKCFDAAHALNPQIQQQQQQQQQSEQHVVLEGLLLSHLGASAEVDDRDAEECHQAQQLSPMVSLLSEPTATLLSYSFNLHLSGAAHAGSCSRCERQERRAASLSAAAATTTTAAAAAAAASSR